MRIESVRELTGQFPDVDGYWDFDDLPKTEARIKQILTLDTEAGFAALSEVLSQLIRVQALQGKFPEAKASLEEFRKAIEANESLGTTRPMIRFLLEQGRILCLSMVPTQAQIYFKQAWDLALKLNEPFFAIDAATMLSICSSPKSQSEWLQKAIKLAEESKDPQSKLWLGQLYIMNGWRLFDLRKPQDALDSFKKSLDQPRVSHDETKHFMARWCYARALREMKQVQEALNIQRELYTELSQTGKSNGYIFLEMAECLQLLTKTEEARAYFESAHKELLLNAWYADNRQSELARIQYLAKKR